MALRNSYLGNIYYTLLQKFIVPKLKESGLGPNKITIIGGVVSLMVPLGFYFSPLIGAMLILVSAIFDSLDGQIARSMGEKKFGAFLDSTVDRVSDFFYLMGLMIVSGNTSKSLILTFLIFIALVLTLLFSYTKARIEGLGGSCNVGFMERAKRVIYLIVLSVFIPFFNSSSLILYGIIVYNFLLIYSIYQRILCAKKVLK
ncbi:archaetidylinositol phosphate synthase [Desulfothermus okinawensis JCM 13304]